MPAIPGDASDIAGVMLDWQERIWVATADTGESALMFGVLNPATSLTPRRQRSTGTSSRSTR